VNIHKFCGITLNAEKTTNLFVRFLLLILAISLSPVACSDSSNPKPNVKPEEIGVPYLDFRQKEHQVDGMVLAPSGERLYVLENAVLFQYGLNPLRKINTVKLDLDYDRDFIKGEKYWLFISNDEKRLIFYHPKRIMLVDLDSKSVINTVNYESKNGILNDEEFFTIEENYTAIVWRVNDLTKLKEFKLDFHGMHDDLSGLTRLHKINDNLIFFEGSSSEASGVLAVLDSKTYRSSLVIQHINEGTNFISGDLQRLRIVRAWDVDDRLASTRKRVNEIKIPQITFDLKIREITEEWEKDGYQLIRPYLQLSHTKKYCLVGTNFLMYPNKNDWTGIYHFDDGEMILFNPSTKHFQITENAREHIKMKDRNGNIAPINDVTFENYHNLNFVNANLKENAKTIKDAKGTNEDANIYLQKDYEECLLQIKQRYQISDDEKTVLDSVTQLNWQRCSVGQIWDGKTCTGKPKEFNWEQAKSLEKDGWRLPTIEEQSSLRYCSSGKPFCFGKDAKSLSKCLDNYQKPTIATKIFPNTPIDWFWSDSPISPHAEEIRTLHFGQGLTYYLKHYYHLPVRLVQDRGKNGN
jgi:hypothetical protein